MTEQTPRPLLGPIHCAILITRHLGATVAAYEQHLGLHLTRRHAIDPQAAAALGHPELSGCPAVMLAGGSGREWLLAIEYDNAVERNALRSHGWLAMEVLVDDVDELANSLDGSPFEVLRPPADLDVSDRIRACQARGPSGEILYLTQVKGPVTPFELPTCSARVDHLFIAVLSTAHRDRSMEQFEALAGNEGLRFETKITVVNQALGLPMEERHPVGTVQLQSASLIEIDEIAQATAAPHDLRLGVFSMVFEYDGEPPSDAVYLQGGIFGKRYLLAHRGAGGETTALIYRSATDVMTQ
ncbi:MAG: VOC family protein [Pseudomonadota bacterium]